MNDTRFNIGDPVIYRENSSFSSKFNFDIEPLYIVIGLVINDRTISSSIKKQLLSQGYYYIICNIKEDCGSGYLGGVTYAKESQLRLYTENDSNILSFYYDVKKELEKK